MMLTSVDNETFTGDQGRSVAEEEHGGVGDILDDACAPKRNPRFMPSGVSSAKAAHAFGGGDGSGRNNVGSNAPRTLLDGDHT